MNDDRMKINMKTIAYAILLASLIIAMLTSCASAKPAPSVARVPPPPTLAQLCADSFPVPEISVVVDTFWEVHNFPIHDTLEIETVRDSIVTKTVTRTITVRDTAGEQAAKDTEIQVRAMLADCDAELADVSRRLAVAVQELRECTEAALAAPKNGRAPSSLWMAVLGLVGALLMALTGQKKK
jgi:hypothetical protein